MTMTMTMTMTDDDDDDDDDDEDDDGDDDDDDDDDDITTTMTMMTTTKMTMAMAIAMTMTMATTMTITMIMAMMTMTMTMMTKHLQRSLCLFYYFFHQVFEVQPDEDPRAFIHSVVDSAHHRCRVILKILKYKAGNDFRAADNILGLCEALHIVSTYSTLCAFAWMFVEGLYLNTLISSAVFGRPNFIRYYIIAWVLPIPFVLAWSIAMFATYSRCWPLHTDSPYYLALIEIPRDIIFILNSVFLLHIIYVLVTKLKNNNSGETQVIRKAVKALFVLCLFWASAIFFGVFLIRKQPAHQQSLLSNVGSFSIRSKDCVSSLLFLNKEVRVLIKRKWRIWVNFMDTPMRRTSMITSTSDVRINLVMMNGKFNE
ncbi:putative PDF receptor isoform X1 [Apostichopus japonicus]|uniref:Putative PDF receptor isoform X1 n=1 Tax=Stichopus japonicus TaxID=307972 RepID=A0A2G8KPR8_STIJA|nr:putative PDF receptor isoform X1 [Apostichopus japonicus]